MMNSVSGVYRNGKVELTEPVANVDGARVIVTFVPDGVDLHDHGISESQAADLRNRLATFSEDWDRADMTVYDNLPAR